MSRIRSGNTKPEIAVRRTLHVLGYRFRLHRKKPAREAGHCFAEIQNRYLCSWLFLAQT